MSSILSLVKSRKFLILEQFLVKGLWQENMEPEVSLVLRLKSVSSTRGGMGPSDHPLPCGHGVLASFPQKPICLWAEDDMDL